MNGVEMATTMNNPKRAIYTIIAPGLPELLCIKHLLNA